MKKFFLFLICGAFFWSKAQPVVGFTPLISSGLTKPLDIVHAGDGSNRLFLVQQNGIIRVYANGALLATPFLNISSIITFDNSGERGLLSLAFHPDYENNGYFFVYYNNTAGNVTLAQYRVAAGNANTADAGSGKVLLTIAKPYTNHNGCKLLFGPDGNLYFGTGDGGSGGDPQNYAQNPGSLLGKMIRINVDNFTDATVPYYDIPATNPFISTSGYRPEIYATGLRNPWRWSFDRLNNDMWIADVGQDAWEEVNHLPLAQTSGANYGWRCYEGTATYNVSACGTTPDAGKTFPVFQYGHNTNGGYSITGGLVYRGTEFPALQGFYVCCDYIRPNGWLIRPTGTSTYEVYQQTNFPTNLSTFGEAEDGSLYAASLSSGIVYKVVVTSVLPIRLLSFSGAYQAGHDQLRWTASIDASLDRFELEQSTNGTLFVPAGRQLPQRTGTTAAYQLEVNSPSAATRYYRLKMVYRDGKINYSAIVKIDGKPVTQVTAVYQGNGQFRLFTPAVIKSVAVLNMAGQRVAGWGVLQPGSHILNSRYLVPGVYMVQVRFENGEQARIKMGVQ